MKRKDKPLKQLEREQDLALIVFWEAVEATKKAKFDMEHTKEAMVYYECVAAEHKATLEMSKIRLAYLKAKVSR